jgi:hypothetical protein
VAKLSYPTEIKISRPVLIDEHQLHSLDELVSEHLDSLREERDLRLAAEVEDLMAKRQVRNDPEKAEAVEKARKSIQQELSIFGRFREEEPSATIFLKNGRQVTAPTLTEAIAHPVGDREVPLGFLYTFKVGDIRVRVRAGGDWGNELLIEVTPNESLEAQNAFGALRNWAANVEAPLWQRNWLKIRFVFAILLYFWVFIGLVSVPLWNWGDAGKSYQKSEARKLVASGVKPGDEDRAIQLLLALASDYDAGTPASPLGTRYWTYFGLGTLVLIAACICPPLCIGVWRGRVRLRFWRSWMKKVAFTLPAVGGTSILLPWILHWLKLSPPNP